MTKKQQSGACGLRLVFRTSRNFSGDKSLCIFNRNTFQALKLGSYFAFPYICNMLKEQLSTARRSQFQELLFRPDKLLGLSRNDPLHFKTVVQYNIKLLHFLVLRTTRQNKNKYYINFGITLCSPVCRVQYLVNIEKYKQCGIDIYKLVATVQVQKFYLALLISQC